MAHASTKTSTKVSLVKCNSYEQKEVDKAVKKAVDYLGGIKKIVKTGDKVLIKPNLLLAATPQKCVTTNPAILYSVISLVKSAGAIVYVGDSPGFGSTEHVMRKAGLFEVCQKTNVKILDFDSKSAKKFENKQGKVAKSFLLHKDLFDFDIIINLPKLKTHSFTDYTGAVKNLFGLVVGLEKPKYHLKFQDKVLFYEMLLDLHTLVKPKLTIMDAVVGMEGDGPNAGTPRKIGAIISSTDALALDYVATKIISMENTALHLAAEKRDVVPDVEVVGENIEKLIISDFKKPASYSKMPNAISSALKKIFMQDPVVDRQKCTGCKTCFIVCPSEPKTISMQKGNNESKRKNPKDIYPVFDYKNCIHCYCCHESCPEKAIFLKRRLI